MAKPVSTFGPAHFLNRELSWLEFNQRVLEEARCTSNPLLERLKFLCITNSNLDEFFEVRVAGLKEEMESGVPKTSFDGRTPAETLGLIQERIARLVQDQYNCWNTELAPALEKKGICFLQMSELDGEDLQWVEHYFRTQAFPVLTPLAIDPVHPFPQLLNKSLNILVQLQMKTGDDHLKHLAVVQVPRVLPAVVRLPRDDTSQYYLFLGDIVGYFLKDLFPGTAILGHWHFRVTRNSELYLDEQGAGSLRKAIETELHNRRKGDAVRLEIDHDCPLGLRQAILSTMRLTAEDVTLIDGPLNLGRLMAIYESDHSRDLHDPPFEAPPPAALRNDADIFETIRTQDILMHHPYESFNKVVELLEQAARDPHVLAIKQTLYRTGGDTRIVGALMEAARQGKQVTAVVELRARFDEANNIRWSRRMEEAGVHVVYGLVGYKIHCKLCLIVRQDDTGLRRYVHLSTGNYNATTARFYTDAGLLTCQPDFGEDATNIFNLLTGLGHFSVGKKILLAPFQLHRRMLHLIEREAEAARGGLPARIIAKMNALCDGETIEALYRASQAGVKIDLIVRGLCSLRPGVPGVSENITVRSVVDRFLEHSRILYFENEGDPEIFLGSADWMPRNFFRRIEAVFPIEDAELRRRVKQELLDIPLRDEVKAWELHSSGVYRRPRVTKKPPLRSQVEFMNLATRPTPVMRRKPSRLRGLKAACWFFALLGLTAHTQATSILGLTGTVTNIQTSVPAATHITSLAQGSPTNDLDLKRMAGWAINYLMRTPRTILNFEPVFQCHPLQCPPVPAGFDPVVPCDTDARMNWEWYYMREVSGLNTGKDREASFHRRLLSYVQEDGTVLCAPGCYSEGDIHKVYQKSEYVYHIWGATKILQALAEDYRRTGNHTSKETARKVMLRLKRAAVFTAPDICYLPAGMGPLHQDNTPIANGWNKQPAPLVGPLVNYYSATGDAEALTFARAYANGILGGVQPGGLQIGADGNFNGGHGHATAHAVWGIAELGLATGDDNYTAFAKRCFDWMLAQGTGTGWFPAAPVWADNCNETCCISDMTSLAADIARSGHPEYYDYVERYLRNYISNLQFILTPEFTAYYRRINAAAGTNAVEHGLAELAKFQGGVVGGSGLNDYENELLGRVSGFEMFGCCAPEGMRAIYTAWENTIEWRTNGVYVNMNLSRESKLGRVVSFFPKEGRMTVKAGIKDRFFLRPPHWVSRDQVLAFVDKKPVSVKWSGDYVCFEKAKRGQELTLTYPLVSFSQTVRGLWKEATQLVLTYQWVGNEVVSVDPAPKLTPLFLGHPRVLPSAP